MANKWLRAFGLAWSSLVLAGIVAHAAVNGGCAAEPKAPAAEPQGAAPAPRAAANDPHYYMVPTKAAPPLRADDRWWGSPGTPQQAPSTSRKKPRANLPTQQANAQQAPPMFQELGE